MPCNRRPVWDLSTRFTPLQIGSALSNLWALDGPNLVPVTGKDGNRVPCPITLQPLQEPVLLGDGSVFERDAIAFWLEQNKEDRSPLTNLKLPHTAMLRLEPLRAAMEVVMSQSAASQSSELFGFRLHNLMKEAKEKLDAAEPAAALLKTAEGLEDYIEKSNAEIRRLQDQVAQAQQWKERLALQIERDASKRYVARRVHRTQQSDISARSAKQVKAAAQVYLARAQLCALAEQSRALSIVHAFARTFSAKRHLAVEQRYAQRQRIQLLGEKLTLACEKLFGLDGSNGVIASTKKSEPGGASKHSVRVKVYRGMDARAWYNLASKGGGTIDGQTYAKSECIIQSLELNPEYAYAWNNLGIVGGGCVKGHKYITQECYSRALELNPAFALAWNNLGTVGGGTIGGCEYQRKDCYIRALELNISSSLAWNSLGIVGGGTVNGCNYDKKECYIRALETDPKYVLAWKNLGIKGGGTVNGTNHTQKECFSIYHQLKSTLTNPHHTSSIA